MAEMNDIETLDKFFELNKALRDGQESHNYSAWMRLRAALSAPSQGPAQPISVHVTCDPKASPELQRALGAAIVGAIEVAKENRVGDGSGYAYMLRDELLNHLKELRDDPSKHGEFFALYRFSDGKDPGAGLERGEEGAGLPGNDFTRGYLRGAREAVDKMLDSASAEPQRAFGPIREAAKRVVLAYQWKDPNNVAWALGVGRAIDALDAALLGEAPPKAEQDNVTYELPPGATVQPQARNQEEK